MDLKTVFSVQHGNTANDTTKGRVRFYWDLWAVHILLGLIIVIGNLSIIIVFSAIRQFRIPTNMFLAGLAFADLLVGILFIPMYIGGHFIEYEYSVGISDAIDIILLFTFFASAFNMYAVTYDRYVAVTNPLRYNAVMTTKRVRTIMIMAWMLPLLLISSLLVTTFKAEDTVGYLIFVYEIIFVVIPAFFVAWVYYRIFREAQRQIDFMTSATYGTNSAERSRQVQKKSETRVAKTCAILLFVFVICWLPTFGEQLAEFFVEVSTIVRDISLTIMILNSAINPFLYGFSKREFRRKFCRLLCSKFVHDGTNQVGEIDTQKQSNVTKHDTEMESVASTRSTENDLSCPRAQENQNINDVAR